MSTLSAAALVFGLTLCVSACEVYFLAENVHEDFESTVRLDPDGEFSVANVHGSIQLAAWDRDEVRIEERKSASSQEALEQIEIEVRGEGDRVEVKTRYPKMGWFFGASAQSITIFGSPRRQEFAPRRSMARSKSAALPDRSARNRRTAPCTSPAPKGK